MRSDVRNWNRSCIKCQQSKVQQHVHSPIASFDLPRRRFDVIHMDLVGPLPPNHGNHYLLTIIDCFTRWPEAIPLPHATTEYILNAMLLHWVARFGVPSTIITDRGAQFSSSLWQTLCKSLGIRHQMTTSYHPQANGMVERFHRTMKAALRDQDSASTWITRLPLVLLGIRSAIKTDLGSSAAEYVYGEPMRLPGDFIHLSQQTTNNEFIKQLRRHMGDISPVSPRASSRKIFIHGDLPTAEYVMLRNDGYRPPLSSVYDGPFKVISRKEKTFEILRRGRKQLVSIDRLKPAFIENDQVDISPDQWLESTCTSSKVSVRSPSTTERRSSRRRVQTNFFGIRVP